jgi:cytochrome P450
VAAPPLAGDGRPGHHAAVSSSSPSAPPRLPPGRTGLPFVGEWFQILFNPRFGAERRAEFGNVSRTRLFRRDMALLSGPDNNLLVFRGEHKLVEATWPASTLALLGPNTLSTQEGELHLRRRRLLAQAFRPKALVGYLPVMQQRIDAALDRWLARRELALYPEIRALTFDIAAALMMGAGERTDPALVRDFETFAAGLFTIPADLPITAFGRAKRARRRLIAHLHAAIDARAAAGPGGHDVLGLLLAARDDDGSALAREELAEQMLVLLFAGHETLTSGLTNFCMLMAQHPDVYARVCAEASRVTPSGPLTVDALAALADTERALAETLRLHPPVAAAFRKSLRDFEVDGYTVPAGWLTGYRIRDTHHDGDLFREPCRFDPDRFAVFEESCPHGRTHAHAHEGRYLPFGGGARICLGMEFARLEMRAFAALLARRCALALAPGQDLTMKLIPVPRPRSGLLARVTPR